MSAAGCGFNVMPLSGGAEGRTVWRGGLSKTGTSSDSRPMVPQCIRNPFKSIRAPRLETSPYRFNTSSDGRMVIFLKTDRDSEAIVRYCTYRLVDFIMIEYTTISRSD